MEPRKATKLPQNPISTKKLKHDGQNERDYIMKEKFNAWKDKTVLRSRTIVSISIAIIGFALGLFGIDVDLGSVVDSANGLQLGELLTGVGLVLAYYFRKFIKTDLATPGVGGVDNTDSSS